jgi:hypothetical protein
LCGGYNHAIHGSGNADNALLHGRQFGVADFDTQVTARNHYHVGGPDDFFQRVHGLGALDFSNNAAVTTGLAQQVPSFVDILSVTREGYGYVVSLHLRRHLDVSAVLVGNRLRGQSTALAVDTLVVGQYASDHHTRIDFAAFDFLDPQHHSAVIEQQRVAAVHIFDQRLVGNTNALNATGFRIQRSIQDETPAFLEFNLAVLETVDTNLRSLQVCKHADLPAVRTGPVADCLGTLQVFFR